MTTHFFFRNKIYNTFIPFVANGRDFSFLEKMFVLSTNTADKKIETLETFFAQDNIISAVRHIIKLSIEKNYRI